MPSVWFLWVLFAGEKIGEGIGRIRRQAQHHTAEGFHMNLAVLFAGEKIGEGIGWTRIEAQHHAAEGSFMNFAVRFGILFVVSLSIMCILFKGGDISLGGIAVCLVFMVLFAAEKIGEGIGRTRREAQHHVAEGSFMNLAGEI
ncbi:hypothetical protein RHMOL_Rhmol02G0146400 [Rhododendron molle]|uniref:Uncharacterized protein n=1 Tax=Rhododendron molle TaxID=49168 RepID=A0ACC0PRH9_RHOML|nr:hypothetical protein RHMOL_Rhmol02G0146400 [Rhododendron molle]